MGRPSVADLDALIAEVPVDCIDEASAAANSPVTTV
jgi:hypothetical protein